MSDNELQDASKPTPTEPAAMAAASSSKARPKLDLSADSKPGERRRGKSMFGLVLGTLNKAKIEDKERNASEAAKKRQLIEQRLQIKLRKENDSVRRAEEAKKDKTTANRKEEELQLKDSIYKLRRTRLPLLANFLCTSDKIPDIDEEDSPSADPLAPPPRSHPPPLYYLPAILTPSQEVFLKKRKEAVTEGADKEWQLFREERTTGIDEIRQLRQRVVDEEAKKKARGAEGGGEEDAEMDVEGDHVQEKSAETSHSHTNGTTNGTKSRSEEAKPEAESMSMDVDESPAAPAAPATASDAAAGTGPSTTEKDGVPRAASASVPPEKKDTGAMQADDEEAVEY